MSEYDSFAKDFSQTRQQGWPEFDMLLPLLHKGDRLLDLGCGNGRLRKFIPTEIIRAGEYFGLDISENLLQVARNEFGRDHFFRGDFGKELPFGKENFDAVVSIAAFHHLLSKKDQLQFLAECNRVLKNRGLLFLTTWKLPQKYFWSNVLSGRWKNWIIPFGEDRHERTYRRVSDSDLRKLLRKTGFEVERCELFRDKNYVAIARKKQ